MKEKKYLTTYVCDNCGKVIGTIYEDDNDHKYPYYDNLAAHVLGINFNYLTATVNDVAGLGEIIHLRHKADHLCENCREKLIYKIKEDLMDLGFEEDETTEDSEEDEEAVEVDDSDRPWILL